MRTGLIAEKIGMMRVFTDEGEHVSVTVLRVDQCQVTQVKRKEKEGYTALQVGVGTKKAQRLTKPLKGHFAKNNLVPKQKLAEFRVSEENLLEVGAEIRVDHFTPGRFVDVVGLSIGKGFAGCMKRHNFGGLRASHGVSITHRSHGSTGNRQDPGRVFKGKKMAGHLGSARITTQNLKVIRTDIDKGLIMLRGSVPGSNSSFVLISDAIKKSS